MKSHPIHLHMLSKIWIDRGVYSSVPIDMDLFHGHVHLIVETFEYYRESTPLPCPSSIDSFIPEKK